MLAPGTRLGPYEVLSALGAGGMGEVYRARDTRLGRQVALKILPAELSADSSRLRRFEQEARAASALNHPNIIVLHDVGRTDSISFIAMEMVEGRSLRQELLAPRSLSLKRILAIATQIADGLARAHAAGIVHRDLKPDNVMVNEDGLVKILDFGLAKFMLPAADKLTTAPTASVEVPQTESGTIVGTVGYMSPEQAAGREVDFRADQFSFGSILYEMSTGNQAFRRASAAQTLAAIIQEEPEPLASAVPLQMRWIVERCLAKEPNERYASTRDLAKDLARLRDGLADASAARAPLSTEIRRPVFSRSSLAAVLGIAAGIAIGLLLAHRAPDKPPVYHRVTFRRGTVANARFAPDGQTILYTARFEGKDFQIYATRLDSPESTPLALPAASLVSVSDAGKLLIGLPRGDTLTLAEVPLAGGAPREILEGLPAAGAELFPPEADFAPGGEGLVVVHKVNDRDRLEFPIGKVLYDPGPGGGLMCPRFSPKGDRVAFFESEAGATFSVAVVDRKGKKTTLSRNWGDAAGLAWNPKTGEVWFSARESDADPGRGFLHAVSPSGRHRVIGSAGRMAVVRDILGDGRVLLVDTELPSQVMCLPPGATKEVDLAWFDFSECNDLSADGKTILLSERGYAGGHGGAAYLRKTDGSSAVRLGEGYPIALSPDGKWAVCVLLPSMDRLILLPTGAGQPKTLHTQGMAYSTLATWLPDGKRILFSGELSGHGEALFVQDLEGGSPRPVTPEGTVRLDGPIPVSPDGKFVAVRGPGDVVFLYPIEGGQPRAVPEVRPSDRLNRWDERGEALFLTNGNWPPVRIERLELSSGRRQLWKELAPIDTLGLRGMGVLLTPDGKSYAYTLYRDLSSLYVVDGLK